MIDQPILSVVVEGPTVAVILRAIFNKELSGTTRFFSGQGRISLASLGRNILVHEGGPVLLVMDSNTRDPRQSEERLAMARFAMRSVGSGGRFEPFAFGRFDAFIFVPEIEIVFFEAPTALERLLGRPLSPETLEDGLLIPKATLGKLLRLGHSKTSYDDFLKAVDPEAAQDIASGKQATALRTVVEAIMAPAVNA